ncbi:MAG TPA: lysylphosphatidylglycerol synthase transmembrane domain-containing protein [Solirubrobacteraceae bacterium]|nr:lysylphosphatidylglycerol synthase transmembrane domain-containing protein [Solirubrobacteraceae bacterium]
MAAPGASGDPYARQLRRSVLGLLAIVAVVIALVSALPGLDDISGPLSNASMSWLLAAIGLEFLSCVGYVLTVLLAFPRGRTVPTARLAWAELAANAVLPAGGLGGLGLGAWVLTRKGVPSARIAERSTVVFMLTSAASVAALVVVGLGLGLGLLSGPQAAALTLFPAAIGLAVLVAALAGARTAERIANRSRRPRVASTLTSLAAGVRATNAELRRGNWKLLGALGYFVFDVATLAATFAAIGVHPPIAAIAMAHLVGQLASTIPVPGGIGVVDGGLVAALVLYGVAFAPATAAVLLYRAIALVLPAILGTIAFLILRRSLDQPLILRPGCV